MKYCDHSNGIENCPMCGDLPKLPETENKPISGSSSGAANCSAQFHQLTDAVYNNLTDKQKLWTSRENVEAVMDAMTRVEMVLPNVENSRRDENTDKT